MKEQPVFVPCGDKHIAAVVTLPEGEPRAVVLFTTGGGGTLRSQRFRLWTRAARDLADRGIASVRMEFAGVGDSTGRVVMGFKNLPIDDVKAMAEFAMQVAGTSRLGLCGNCGGARTSLKAVRFLPTCESMVLFWLKPLASTAKRRPLLSSVIRIVQKLPAPIRRAIASIYLKARSRFGHGSDVASSLGSVAPNVNLLLIETRGMLKGSIPHMVEELRRASPTHRIELYGIDSTSMRAFQSLADQEAAVNDVVSWFTESFGADPVVDAVSAEAVPS